METNSNKFFSISSFLTYTTFFLLPILFLPLTIAPVEINKFFIFTTLTLLGFIFYLFGSISSNTIRYSSSFLNFPIIFLIFVAGISGILSKYKTLSFYGNLSLPDSFLSFFIYALFYFLAAVHFRKQNIKLLGILFVVALASVVFIGLSQFFELTLFPWGFTQNYSFNTIGTVGALGLFVSLGFVIILSLLSSIRTDEELKLKNITRLWIIKFILNSLAILCLLIIFLTNLKLIWLQIALMLFCLFLYQLTTKKLLFSKNNIALLIYLIIFVALFFLSFQLDIQTKFPTEIRPNLQSTLIVLNNTLSNHNPVIGTGPSTFTYSWLKYRPAELNDTAYWSARFSQGFNFALTLASTLGGLGIFALVFLILAFFSTIKSIHSENKQSAVIFTAVFYLLLNLFFYPTNLTQLGFLFFGLGIIASISGTLKEIKFDATTKKMTLGLIAIIVCVIILLFQISRIYIANIYYAQAIKNWQNKNDKNALTYLIKASNFDPKSSLYNREISRILLPNNFNVSIQSAKRAIELEPFEPLNWINIGQIYSAAENDLLFPVLFSAPKNNNENDLSFSSPKGKPFGFSALIQTDPLFQQMSIESYKKAIELDPLNPALRIELDKR